MFHLLRYTQLDSSDLTVTILNNVVDGDIVEECFLGDLLARESFETTQKTIFRVGQQLFLLYTIQVPEPCQDMVEDVTNVLTSFIRSGKVCVTAIYTSASKGNELNQKREATSTLVTLSRFEGQFYRSLCQVKSQPEIDLLDDGLVASLKTCMRKSKEVCAEKWRYSIIFRAAIWSILAVFCIGVAASLGGARSSQFHQYIENGIWVRYDVRHSQGPRYQLQFTHHNASSWAATHAHDNDEWAFRIDDQAMIPAHLMDEEEERYQRWFQKRYPEKNLIRLNQDYIKDSWLGDPDKIQVPTDKQFHMAHCVRALRRYWQAKETGKHVCPRDIDYRHMKHCLDSMDEWAFPDGERGSVKPAKKVGNYKLIWETKVCF